MFESARKLSLLVDETVEKVKGVYHRVESKVKSWGRDLCNFFNIDIPDFLKETGKTIILNDPNNELIISKDTPNKLTPVNPPVTIDINKPDLDA